MTTDRFAALIIAAMVGTTPIVLAEHPGDENAAGIVHVRRTRESFPDRWISIGGAVLDASLLNRLRDAFPAYYMASKTEEGFASESVCVRTRGGYLVVKNGDFGPGIDLTNAPQKQWRCAETDHSWDAILALDSGLKLGQSKDDVGKVLRIDAPPDRLDLYFEEELPGDGQTVYRLVSLRLDFVDGTLIRLGFADMRE